MGLRVTSSNPRQGLKISSNLNFTFHSPVSTSNPAFQWQTGSISDESGDAGTVMAISGLGNVGIGIAYPGDRLHVRVSGSDSGISLDDGGLNYNPFFTISRVGVPRLSLSATSLVGTVSGRGGNGLALSGNNTAQDVLITANGNVGIGTTSPTQKLSVNGTIRAKEVIVETSGWSDYVFTDNYALQSLAEVEQHIKEHKQLPGIPSAQQVAENGIGVGEMQAKLLAKIEELTLHQIELEKRVNSQAEQIADLKRKNTGFEH